MKVRKLTDDGLNRFNEYMKIVEQKKQNIPNYLLEDNRYSAPVDCEILIDLEKTFGSRYELGVYLHKVFGTVDITPYISHQGFWSWLALLWFDQLCPETNDGLRKVSKAENYILSLDYKHRQRHSIYMTWKLYESYGDKVKFLFSKPLNIRGDLSETFFSRNEIVNSQAAMLLASDLYYEANENGFKRGSTSGRSPCLRGDMSLGYNKSSAHTIFFQLM